MKYTKTTIRVRDLPRPKAEVNKASNVRRDDAKKHNQGDGAVSYTRRKR